MNENLFSDERLNGEEDSEYKTAYENHMKNKDKYIEIKNNFEEDYNKIINSYPFRRLQDKTQVFPLEQHDFIRTRLTHSIEVSGIAKELGKLALNFVNIFTKAKIENDNINKATEILMCAGIVHDFGNPPFGHYGEKVIKNWFRNWFEKYEKNQDTETKVKNENQKKKEDYIYKTVSNFSRQMKEDLKNFDGNVQNLRILIKLNNSYKYEVSDEKSGKMGLNLTAALLDTIIKYPKPSYDYENQKVAEDGKFGYNLAEQFIYEEIIKKTRGADANKNIKHPLTFILEAADDIAYLTADFEDAIKKKILTVKSFIKFFKDKLDEYFKKDILKAQKNKLEEFIKQLKKQKEKSEELIDKLNKIQKDNPDLNDDEVFYKWSRIVKEWFMYCCSYVFSSRYNCILNGKFEEKEGLFGGNNYHKYSVKIFRDAQQEFIFNEKELLKLELSSEHILSYLLDRFVDAIVMYDVGSEKDKKEDNLSMSERKILKILPNINTYEAEYQQIDDESWKKIYHQMKNDSNLKNKKDEELKEAYKLYLRLLKVVDFISGMTDSYAKNLYQQLNGIY